MTSPAAFYDAIAKINPMQRFFELLIGRPQNIEELRIQLPNADEEMPCYLDVYWPDPPSRDPRHETRRPHHADVLLSPISETESFATVMTKWLAHEAARRSSRVRFSEAFAQQRYYPRDRVVAAANMFDILPDDAVPAAAMITPEVQAAKAKSRDLFRVLPASLERDALLQALGRIGRSSLKDKIRHRAKPIIAATGHSLPDLEFAIDQAVNCRNYFVHGGRASFDYDEEFGTVVFLNNTLEFVFAASDLIDAGWNIAAWERRAFTLSHPFTAYRHTYELNVRELRTLVSNTDQR